MHHNWKKPYRNALLQLTIKVATNVFEHVFGQESAFLAEKEDFSNYHFLLIDILSLMRMDKVSNHPFKS